MSVKGSCNGLIAKLEACAAACDKFLNNTIPKIHCIQPAKDVSSAGKNFVGYCKKHSQTCQNADCKSACQACIPAVEKAIEKSNACALACGGAGSDQDAKEVCKDCAQACKAAVAACKEASAKFCS